jgi:DNA-damage-inducible protein D
MNSDFVQKMQNQFDKIVQAVPDEEVEFWFARDLQEPLGYARWENFQTAIKRAIESCETTGYDPSNHFRGVTKMVKLGSGAERSIDEIENRSGRLPEAKDQ